MKSTLLRWALLAFTFALFTGVSGCAHVQPWDRELLAKPQMALEAHPMQNSLRAHVYGSREASIGGESAGGGGCGCN